MRHTLLTAALVLLLAPFAYGQTKIVPEGDYVLVFKSMPVKLTAPEGAAFYWWNIPSGLTAQNALNVLNITAAEKGEYVVTVSMLLIDWEAQTVTQQDESVKFAYGETPVPPPLPGSRGVILEETDPRNPYYAALWLKLREKYPPDESTTLRIHDDDTKAAEPYVKLVENQTARPLLLILSENGTLVRSVALTESTTVDDVVKELGDD